MPVRSINLKMLLDRGAEGEPARQKLWTTHERINSAVQQVEHYLLLMRGERYRIDDDEFKSRESVQKEALSLARATQKQNGKANAGDDEELLAAMQQLYIALVPSYCLDEKGKPLEGNAQSSREFAGPLMRAGSKGFQDIFEKIVDPLPEWVALREADDPGWMRQSTEWLESEQAKALFGRTGSPPAWIRRLRNKQPWEAAFVEDQKKKQANLAVPRLIRKMQEKLGMLPLFPPPIAAQIAGRDALTKWDYLVLRLAVGHLLSWESWNHRTAEEHRRVEQTLTSLQQRLAERAPEVEGFREYESARHAELNRIALASDRPFRINQRMLRGWERVHEAWGKTDSAAGRIDVLAKLQTQMSGRFGDPDLYRWLAQDGRESLWQNRDFLQLFAKCNDVEQLLERTKSSALYTPPDARLHPKWLNYEPQGGSNLYRYTLSEAGGDLQLELPVLAIDNKGLAETNVAIPLVPSKQFAAPQITTDKKQQHARFSVAHQSMSAVLKASDVILDRRHLENRSTEQIEQGDVGSIWFKLVLDVDSQAPADWLDGRGRVATPPTVHHFRSALSSTSKHHEALEPGLRVLSVDLGMRTFASCAVFELVSEQPADGTCFLADEVKQLWAKHERSFLLALPGERISPKAREARFAAEQELRMLRGSVWDLKNLLRLTAKDEPQERRAGVSDLLVNLREAGEDGISIDMEVKIAELSLLADAPTEEWHDHVRTVYQKMEQRLSETLSAWRRRTRPRTDSGREYGAGKSDWAIQYLTNVRNLLRGWSLHGRQYGQINRADREKQGVFAASLLDHINHLKEDRIKAGTDLIIQAARGYQPVKPKGWVKRHESCRLILFEDLARYRFRTDRPRRENAQLMRWSHREIIREAEMQGEIYGMVVETTGAGFSSRYHGASGAAGCRTRTLTEQDLANTGWFKQALKRVSQRFSLDASKLAPGMRIPWEGGSDFTTLGDQGHALTVHADLNAAQSLQRRFWNRHGEAYRISAVEVRVDEREMWYPDRDSKRILGAIGAALGNNGYARLVPADDGDGFVLEGISRPAWRKAVGSSVAEDSAGSDEVAEQLQEILGDETVERGSQKRVFFRDPSGYVLRSDRWYESRVFWGQATERIVSGLQLPRLPE